MRSRISTSINLLLLAVLFVLLVFLNNMLPGWLRIDLTENQVYSLSKGSKEIVHSLKTPLNLYFFYSDEASKDLIGLRNYADRVESLLQEYVTVSGDKIKLHTIDPVPFSEDEDRATEFGLTAAGLGAGGDAIYLGLAATSAAGEEQIIGFFDPQQEAFLEYEISKLIYKLGNSEQVSLTIMTNLPLQGGQNPMTGQLDPPWTFLAQLQQLYEVQQIPLDASEIPKNTKVLMVIHPKDMPETSQYAVDQYLMDGGNLMLFVDPHFESDPMAMMMGGAANSSSLKALTDAWGLTIDAEKVVLDAETGLEIRTQAGDISRHMGYLGLGVDRIHRKDVTTANLDSVNMASVGEIIVNNSLKHTPLYTTSNSSKHILTSEYAQARDPKQLAQKYTASDAKQRSRKLAVRLNGKLQSAFSAAPEEAMQKEHKATAADNASVMVVADVDVLSDRFWVQRADFFGQTIYTPFANNGDFINNSVENLAGNSALISIRSRGTFARPFVEVEKLTKQAEARFRQQEQRLQQQLDETEAQLMQLQTAGQGEQDTLVLSAEQQKAVDDFLQQKLSIRKKLREVRHQLDKDIQRLGDWLKLINIAVAPLVLVLLLYIFARLLRGRYRKA